MPKKVLLIDDDASIRTILIMALQKHGFQCEQARSAIDGLKFLKANPDNFFAIISDVYMPGLSGIDAISEFKVIAPELPVIVISAQNTAQTALEASEAGAFGYLSKPFDIDELISMIRKAAPQNDKSTITKTVQDRDFVGRSPLMQKLFIEMGRVAPSDFSVLIQGETGTGKEVVARQLHKFSTRSNGPFIAVNMGAIPTELIESELFGHVKGAFTGAITTQKGLFERARGGTIFLDEIGDMPLSSQVRLLRVLQEGEYMPVGGREAISTNVRIIAATHRNLAKMVGDQSFREDLLYRLNVVNLRVPPLRERLDDIKELAELFVHKFNKATNQTKRFTRQAVAQLEDHHWQGNIRELENYVTRTCLLTLGDIVDINDLPHHEPSASSTSPNETSTKETMGLSALLTEQLENYFEAHGASLPAKGLYQRVLRELERPLLRISLKATNGNQIKAAELLGLNRNTLRKKLKELKIDIVKSHSTAQAPRKK